MEMILFSGLQGSGKSSYWLRHFSDTHVRVNLDMLRTRQREALLFQACVLGKQRFVVDNTNLERSRRLRYIVPALAAGFRIVGFDFECSVTECLRRNANRKLEQRVPDRAIFASASRYERPDYTEGYTELYTVETSASVEGSASFFPRPRNLPKPRKPGL